MNITPKIESTTQTKIIYASNPIHPTQSFFITVYPRVINICLLICVESSIILHIYNPFFDVFSILSNISYIFINHGLFIMI